MTQETVFIGFGSNVGDRQELCDRACALMNVLPLSQVTGVSSYYETEPVDPEGGSLCFRYFGWELLDQLRAVGFCRVRALAYWSENQGYLGKEQYLFICHKQG